jgi:glycosyltransferase involved in cell wall biosynthesis
MTGKKLGHVPTFNEEAVIRDRLESLRWAEVFVVDSFSRDKTLEIARE